MRFAIFVSFGFGLFAFAFDVEQGVAWVNKTHHIFSAVTQALIVGQFIWKFRSGGTPPAIPQKFIADLGGSPTAVITSHYLSSSFGLGALILFFGLLVGSVGHISWVGCTILVLFCLAFARLLVYTRVSTGVKAITSPVELVVSPQ